MTNLAAPPALPHSHEAEQSVLGALMYDNAVIERLPEHLRPEHFFEPFHVALFDAIRTTIASGGIADPTMLVGAVRDHPAFEQFGGLRYLADLLDKSPPANTARDHAALVYDLALRRDLIRVADQIASDARDTTIPAAGHIAAAEATLFSIAEAGSVEKGVATFGEALRGAMQQAEAAYRNDGSLTGLSTHLDDLDQKLGGLHSSDLLIVAGRPSMGKTALATNIAFNVARRYRAVPDETAPAGLRAVDGGRVFFGSLEMSKEQLASRIVSDAAGVSGDRIRRGAVKDYEFARMRDVAEELAHIPLHIDETGAISISRFAARARRQHRRTGIDLIVVDYLQLMTTGAGGGQRNRVQEVSEITGGLKALAKELNVPIIALSQLSRQVENRDDKRPQLSDLRESGSIEQDADCVMFVYREAYYVGRAEPREGTTEHQAWADEMDKVAGLAEVIIGKQRHGPIGTVRLAFDEDTIKFSSLAREASYDQAPRDASPREPVYSFGGGQ